MNQRVIEYGITTEIEVSEPGHYIARFTWKSRMGDQVQDGDVMIRIAGDSPFLLVGRVVALPSLSLIENLGRREKLVIYKKLEIME